MAERGEREQSQPAQGTGHAARPELEELASYIADAIIGAHGLYALTGHAQMPETPDISIDLTDPAPYAEKPSGRSHLQVKVSRYTPSRGSEAAEPFEATESTGAPTSDG